MPRFVTVLYSYNQTLVQRNALLKRIASDEAGRSELEPWDIYAAGYAAEIALRRDEYCKELSEAAGRIYEGISSGRERLELEYSCSYMEAGDGKERDEYFVLNKGGRGVFKEPGVSEVTLKWSVDKSGNITIETQGILGVFAKTFKGTVEGDRMHLYDGDPNDGFTVEYMFVKAAEEDK